MTVFNQAAENGSGAGEDAVFVFAEILHSIFSVYKGNIVRKRIEQSFQLMNIEIAAGQIDIVVASTLVDILLILDPGFDVGRTDTLYPIDKGIAELVALLSDDLPGFIVDIIHQHRFQNFIFLLNHTADFRFHLGKERLIIFTAFSLFDRLLDQISYLIIFTPHNFRRSSNTVFFKVWEHQLFFAGIVPVQLIQVFQNIRICLIVVRRQEGCLGFGIGSIQKLFQAVIFFIKHSERMAHHRVNCNNLHAAFHDGCVYIT